MAGKAGTIELIVLELGRALSGLEKDLAAGNLDSLIGQLGFQMPAGFTAQAGLANALQTVVTKASQLPALTANLSASIDSDGISIGADGANLIAAVQALVDAINQVSGQIPTAAAAVGGDPGAASALASQFGKKLLDYAVIRYLEGYHSVALQALGLFGLIDHVEIGPSGPGRPGHLDRSLRLDRLSALFSAPQATLNSLYGWDDPSFDGRQLLIRLRNLLDSLAIAASIDDTTVPPSLELFSTRFTPTMGLSPAGLIATLHEDVPGGWSVTYQISDRIRAELGLDPSLPTGIAFTLQPNLKITANPQGKLEGPAHFALARQALPGERVTVLSLGDIGGLTAQEIKLVLATDFAWDAGLGQASSELGLSGDVTGGKLTINLADGDGFIAKIVPVQKIDADFAIKVRWNPITGLRFSGSSTLEIRLPAHTDFGPASVEGVTLSAGFKNGGLPIGLGADIKGSLGPMTAIVQDIGLNAVISFPADGRGNLGPVQLDFDFRPPKGIGLSIDAGLIKGGGFLRFDEDKGEYFGALELTFQDIIDLKAVAIINTKMPDGSKGFALLVLITADFIPIHLGFGFTLIGVGGLLGHNRTLDTKALMIGVRTGAMNSVLFPQNVVANITRIVSDLKAIFPIEDGHFLLGPMGKLGWGTPTLVSLEIGVILDMPVPQIVFLGVLRCFLPAEEAPLIKLQVNFVGGIDFDQGALWFNASLFDSRLVQFTLEGDMAVRVCWGSTPMMLLSVGGFHPAFKEVPDDLRDMRRITIALLSGDNPRLAVMTYFAVTSNTVQSGARVELYAEACGFNVYGFLGYDLLIQFNPLHFIADFAAGLALREGTDVIAGISLHGQLSGPAPWNARGEASLKILFVKVSVDFNVTWGNDAPPDPVEVENVSLLVKAALNDDRNWTATFPANSRSAVSLRALKLPPEKIVLHPFGVLAVSQKIVPLGYPLEKFGNKKPDVDHFEMATVETGTEEQREEFAIAQFKKMSDADKLSQNSFDRLRSGLRFSTGDATSTGTPVQKEVNYELSYVHRKSILRGLLYKLHSNAFNTFAMAGAISKNIYSAAARSPGIPLAKFDLVEPPFKIVNTADLSAFGADYSGKTATEAQAMYDSLIKSKPALKGMIQVVAAHELM
jgi:hypothetical protein